MKSLDELAKSDVSSLVDMHCVHVRVRRSIMQT